MLLFVFNIRSNDFTNESEISYMSYDLQFHDIDLYLDFDS